MSTYPRPVPTPVHQLKLFLHPRDIVSRPFCRIDASLDGSILSRKPEGVPPHGQKDVIALESSIASQDVANRIYPQMAEM